MPVCDIYRGEYVCCYCEWYSGRLVGRLVPCVNLFRNESYKIFLAVHYFRYLIANKQTSRMFVCTVKFLILSANSDEIGHRRG